LSNGLIALILCLSYFIYELHLTHLLSLAIATGLSRKQFLPTKQAEFGNKYIVACCGLQEIVDDVANRAVQRNRHTYVPAFDGLRAVAILPVVLLHAGVNTLPNSTLLFEITRGWFGVDLFFVLSGFLITWILIAEIDETGTIDMGRFYSRRFLRLGPAYVSMLTGLLIGAAILEPRTLEGVPRVLPALVTYTYNYQIAAGGPHLDALVVVWSLCVEEQFYLVWPLILRRMGIRRSLIFCTATVCILGIYRTGLYLLLNWQHPGRPDPAAAIWIYFATDTRIDVILIGCATALSLRHPRTRWLWHGMRRSRWFPGLALVSASVCIVLVTGGEPSSASWRSATIGYTLSACATAALIASVFAQPHSLVSRILSYRPLVSLGRVSYGIYLFHVGIVLLSLRALSWASWPGGAKTRCAIVALMGLAITWIVAALHYRYVERWFLSLRDRGHARFQQLESGRSISSPLDNANTEGLVD
jgi:peptidoglycan/LPS O-acetylase OafA/YrhL